MPSLNWFSLNREDGGPAYFGYSNRTPAALYWNDWIYGVVLTVAAFITVLLLLSPVYKHQWRTISLVTTSLLMGGALVLSLVMPWWQSAGPTAIRAPIRVHDTLDMNLTLDVHIGLTYVNITLIKIAESTPVTREQVLLPRLLPRDSVESIGSYDQAESIQFNERVELQTAEEMRHQFREALHKGLPVPILTVMNYLCHQEEGFRWSVDFRSAGFFCQFMLTLTLISWAWMNIFFLVIPRHGAVAMVTTGLLAVLSVFLYWILLPSRDMIIQLNGTALQLRFDGCYWTVLTTGLVAIAAGSTMLIVEFRHPGSLTFDLELDTELKKNSVEKAAEKRSIKLLPALSTRQAKKSLRSRISVIDGTASTPTENITTSLTSVTSNKQDSGICGTDSYAASMTNELEQIATLDGSYFKSTVTNLIQEEQIPKIYSYTFRNGRELPSFHESTISLHSETVPRFLDSIIEEEVEIHRTPEETGGDEWQDAFEGEVVVGQQNESEEESFQSTHSSAHKTASRRRSQRALSIGSHRDIIGNS